MADTTEPNPSPTERGIGRLVVPEPRDFARKERVDWIHDADLEQLLSRHRHGQGDGH